MPIELPPDQTGNLRQDFEALWDWAFHLAEALRLREEEEHGLSQT